METKRRGSIRLEAQQMIQKLIWQKQELETKKEELKSAQAEIQREKADLVLQKNTMRVKAKQFQRDREILKVEDIRLKQIAADLEREAMNIKSEKALREEVKVKKAELDSIGTDVNLQIENERKDLMLKKRELEAICSHLDEREEVQLQRDQLEKERQKIEADAVDTKRERVLVEEMREKMKAQGERMRLHADELEKQQNELIAAKVAILDQVARAITSRLGAMKKLRGGLVLELSILDQVASRIFTSIKH